MKLAALFRVIVIAALAMAASTAAGAQATMKMASATNNDVQYAWLDRFQKEVGSRVGNRLKIEIYPDSQLGEIPQMIEGVLTGSIESFVTPTSFLADSDPRFMVFDAVGVFRSAEHAKKIVEDLGSDL